MDNLNTPFLRPEALLLERLCSEMKRKPIFALARRGFAAEL
jgi:hypothetical protein